MQKLKLSGSYINNGAVVS